MTNKPSTRKTNLGWGYEDIDVPQCEICDNRPQLQWAVICKLCDETIYPMMEDFEKEFPDYYADIDDFSSVLDWLHGVPSNVIDEIFSKGYTPDMEETICVVWEYLEEQKEEE